MSLAFTGHNVVDKDTTGPFPSPEWLDGRADQSPVSYARAASIAFTAKFKVTTPACRPGETVAVKGTATFGAVAMEWTGSVTVNPGDADASVPLTANNPLPNEVGIFETTDITWQMNPCNAGWAAAGTTRNVVYVTLGNPSGTPNYWTLVDVSCRAAAGKTTADDLVAAVFPPYTAAKGDGNGIRRKRDGTQLSYWKLGRNTAAVFDTHDLLASANGTGRCGSWARFLVDMHKVHGVTTSRVLGVVPVSAPALIVQNCLFIGGGSNPPPFTHKTTPPECVKGTGIPGEGKTNPQFTFPDHALVKYNTDIYDPSYGVGPKPDLKTWEAGGIAGLGTGPYPFITQDATELTIPAACSKGFIVHTAVAGDTLASIAALYGIASGAALFGHAYNAALRAAHPGAPGVSVGETVYIPRDISTIQILRALP